MSQALITRCYSEVLEECKLKYLCPERCNFECPTPPAPAPIVAKWVAVQFRKTLLRVGTPWSACASSSEDNYEYPVGSIMPILFGGPNLNSIALRAGNPSYLDVIDELQGVTVPVKVVLEIFPITAINKDRYTDSNDDTQCYRAGNACPEAHLVCQPEFCEIDVWKSIIANFKAAGPQVSVLGSVGKGRTTSDYDTLGDPGVGKTAIAEGLAQMIADGRVPLRLQNKRLLSLELGMLVADTKYRGEFEERLKNVVEEVG